MLLCCIMKMLKQSAVLLLISLSILPFKTQGQPLKVATKELPPFVMKTAQGGWEGLSIDLLKAVCERLEKDYQLSEETLEGMIDGVASGKYDAGVAAITMTGKREEKIDFSHPYYMTGLSIAVSDRDEGLNWIAMIRSFFSLAFLSALAALAFVLLAAGVAIWYFERKANPDQFGGEVLHGLGSGFWWSAVTMTTVGYGDKSPQSLGGRVVGLIWMFSSVIIISGFTASIASSLTVNSISKGINGPDDLAGNQVATVSESTSEIYLNQMRIRPITFSSVDEALGALDEGKVDAVVYDDAVLRYKERNYEGVKVFPVLFETQNYAIALKINDDPLRESVNIALLNILQDGTMEDIKRRY